MGDRKLRSTFDHQMSLETQIVYIIIVTGVYDNTYHSNVGMDTIQKSSRLEKRTIDGALTYLVDNDYIQPAKSGGYVTKKQHYDLFDVSLIGAAGDSESVTARKAEMVALRLASCRLNGTSYTLYTDTEIAKKVGLSRPTGTKYRKILIDSNIIIDGPKRYYLNEDYFPVAMRSEVDIPQEMRTTVYELLRSKGKGGEVFRYYFDKRFTGLTMPIDQFIRYCERGCVGIKRKALSTDYEFPESYEFCE